MDSSKIQSQPLPDCMMPDGAEPCAGFRYEAKRRAELGDAVGRYADRIDALEEALRWMYHFAPRPWMLNGNLSDDKKVPYDDWEKGMRNVEQLLGIVAATPRI